MNIVMNENGISIKQELRPFVEREAVQCPACGMHKSSSWRRFLRKIRGKSVEYIANPSFCPGDKPPTEEARGLAALFSYGFGERINKCSGIERPHLHWHCDVCRAEWLTEVRESL